MKPTATRYTSSRASPQLAVDEFPPLPVSFLFEPSFCANYYASRNSVVLSPEETS